MSKEPIYLLFKFVFLTLILYFFSTTVIAASVPGVILTSSCFACHGPDGKSPGQIPSFHGKSAEYITKAMKEFRSGARPGTVMQRHAKGYSDEEIAAIAKYISGLK